MNNDKIRSPIARDPTPPAWLPFAVIAAVVSAALGAILAYAFDPDRGRGRRIQTLDRTAGAIRKAGRSAERAGRTAVATAASLTAKATHIRDENDPENDATLAHKVESELFRDPDIPKGRIDVNAEDGTVVLRGVASDHGQIEAIEAKVLSISCVRHVRNLLHVEGTPAPTG